MSDQESREALLRGVVARLDTEGTAASDARNGAVRALREMASLAVNVADSPETACNLLASYDARRIIQRLLEASELCHAALLRDPKAGPTPDGGIAANGPSSVVVHLAWLIDEHAAAARMIEIALHPVVIARLPKARFWDAYFIALGGVARASPFELPQLKLRGLEKYWFCCMQLAGAVASQTDRTPFVAAAKAEFEKLNRDSRITDWLSVDGDGRVPVKWSIRLASLLKAIPAKA
jgi:hypothetical protein